MANVPKKFVDDLSVDQFATFSKIRLTAADPEAKNEAEQKYQKKVVQTRGFKERQTVKKKNWHVRSGKRKKKVKEFGVQRAKVWMASI